MGIQKGTVTYRRYRFLGEEPTPSEDALLGQVQAHLFAPIDRNSDELRSVGWVRMEEPDRLDAPPASSVFFDGPEGLEMRLSMRIDSIKIPPSLVKKEVRALLDSRRDENGKLPKGAKKAAKEEALRKLKQRAFEKTKVVEVVWQIAASKLYVFSASKSVCEAFVELFEKSFGLSVDIDGPSSWIPSGTVLEPTEQFFAARAVVEDGGDADEEGDEGDEDKPGKGDEVRDDSAFVGREFLTWLLWSADTGTDTVEGAVVGTGSSVVLRRPVGMLTDVVMRGPSPGASRELQSSLLAGLLPKELDVVLKLEDSDPEKTYDLSLSTPYLDIKRAKLPSLMTPGEDGAIDERIALVGELDSWIKKLFSRFLELRLGASWPDVVGDIRLWMA